MDMDIYEEVSNTSELINYLNSQWQEVKSDKSVIYFTPTSNPHDDCGAETKITKTEPRKEERVSRSGTPEIGPLIEESELVTIWGPGWSSDPCLTTRDTLHDLKVAKDEILPA